MDGGVAGPEAVDLGAEQFVHPLGVGRGGDDLDPHFEERVVGLELLEHQRVLPHLLGHGQQRVDGALHVGRVLGDHDALHRLRDGTQPALVEARDGGAEAAPEDQDHGGDLDQVHHLAVIHGHGDDDRHQGDQDPDGGHGPLSARGISSGTALNVAPHVVKTRPQGNGEERGLLGSDPLVDGIDIVADDEVGPVREVDRRVRSLLHTLHMVLVEVHGGPVEL